MNCTGPSILTILALMASFLAPDSVHAFQSHAEPEALYGHQLAHAFFIIALAILAYWLRANRFTDLKGWFLIQVTCLLLILWNIAAIAGHWVEERIPDASLIGEPDWTQIIRLDTSPWAIYYYALKMDHLLCVPAIMCLFLGIRLLFRNALNEEVRKNG
ncbi:MAG TPA: hypothetical protein VK463_02450 [Desulfomonilaceae bacterium]|nr:hypothetical protein [Desulfomonilaceae bacterium]